MTFRLKLSLTLGIAALGIGIIMLLGIVITGSAAKQLRAIEARFVPLVELRPTLEGSVEQLGRAFQDAVAAEDTAALSAAAAIRQEFLQTLDSADDSLDRATANELRGAFDDYYEAAHAVSLRMIAGDTGIAAVEAITAMQQKRVVLREMLQHVAAFNKGTLAAAFGLVHNALRRADRLRLGVGVATLAAVVFFSTLISREIIRSLVTLTAGFARFGRGDFSRPIDVHRNDEFGDVAQSANQMAQQIQELLQERDRTSAALKETNALLAASNRELEAFSYSVSHDLRAPLRAIDGFSKAILAEYDTRLDDRGRHYLERVRAGSQRMSRLIDDMLKLSRISRAPMRTEPVDISTAAAAVVADLRAREPGRTVEIDIESGLRAQGDAHLIAILLENLIGNAWKFTGKKPAPRITIGREDREGSPVFFVRDNGAGFDPAQADKLFHPFQRLHAESEFEGTGIGLATVKRIAHRHGGTVWADGRVGEGATFYFTLGDTYAEPTDDLAG